MDAAKTPLATASESETALARSAAIDALVAEGLTEDAALGVVDRNQCLACAKAGPRAACSECPKPPATSSEDDVLREMGFDPERVTGVVLEKGKTLPEGAFAGRSGFEPITAREIPDFAHVEDFDASASEVEPAPLEADRLSVGEFVEVPVPKDHIDLEPEKSELEEAQEKIGIGGCIEVGAHEFRVVSKKGGTTRYGHGKTIEAAVWDIDHPGQLPPSVGSAE